MLLTRGRSVRLGGHLYRDSIEAAPSGAASAFPGPDRIGKVVPGPRSALDLPAGARSTSASGSRPRAQPGLSRSVCADSRPAEIWPTQGANLDRFPPGDRSATDHDCANEPASRTTLRWLATPGICARFRPKSSPDDRGARIWQTSPWKRRPTGYPLMAPLRPAPRRNNRWKSRNRAIGMMLEIVRAAMNTSRSVVGARIGRRTDNGWMSGSRSTRSGHRSAG